MATRLAHIRDIRLANNAGINLPACKAGARLLNTSFRGRVLPYAEAVKTNSGPCPACVKAYAKRYPWALERKAY